MRKQLSPPELRGQKKGDGMLKTKKLGREAIISLQLKFTKQSREVWAYVNLQVLNSGNAKMSKRRKVLAGKISWVLGAQDFWHKPGCVNRTHQAGRKFF